MSDVLFGGLLAVGLSTLGTLIWFLLEMYGDGIPPAEEWMKIGARFGLSAILGALLWVAAGYPAWQVFQAMPTFALVFVGEGYWVLDAIQEFIKKRNNSF